MFRILSEPADESCRGLLRLALEHCETFTLVLKRTKVGRGINAKRMESRLKRFSIEEDWVKSWGGTHLMKGAARLGRYRLCEESLELLGEVPGLYSWCLPQLPEDLDFYRADGRPFLVSSGHEREAMLGAGRITERVSRAAAPDVEYEWLPGERWKTNV